VLLIVLEKIFTEIISEPKGKLPSSKEDFVCFCQVPGASAPPDLPKPSSKL
jgi:hypothetical protein